MATLDEIQNEQRAINVMIETLQKSDNPEDLQQIVDMITQSAEGLGEMADAFEKEQTENFPTDEVLKARAGSQFEVVLTAEQRARILEQSGVEMTSVKIEDRRGTRSMAMPDTPPAEIEAIALKKALLFQEMVEMMAEDSPDDDPDGSDSAGEG